MIGEYELLSVGVPREEIGECYQWAFGDGWQYMRMGNMDDVWNDRHGDLFILHGDDLAAEGFERIGTAYLGNRNKK